MYVLGHVGISLLLYAPLAWLLLSTGQPAVAALTGLLMIVLAPLPDLDTYTDRLDHRGPTHTVWFALGVGLVTASSPVLARSLAVLSSGVATTTTGLGGWLVRHGVDAHGAGPSGRRYAHADGCLAVSPALSVALYSRVDTVEKSAGEPTLFRGWRRDPNTDATCDRQS